MSLMIEIATADFMTTQLAVAGGADRIELCDNLAEGGTTPSYAMIRQCREAIGALLYPMIRPRGGDFLYSPEEFDIMLHDVNLCKQLGCDGVVFGLLDKEGNIDRDGTAMLVEAAYPMGVTFHRAFDRCRDPFQAMEELISLGVERILTSGQQLTAIEGVEMIAELEKKADHRIIIMPGSGVRKENIQHIVQQTGCQEFHTSLRSRTRSLMEFQHPSFAGRDDCYTNPSIDPAEVRALRIALETQPASR